MTSFRIVMYWAGLEKCISKYYSYNWVEWNPFHYRDENNPQVLLTHSVCHPNPTYNLTTKLSKIHFIITFHFTCLFFQVDYYFKISMQDFFFFNNFLQPPNVLHLTSIQLLLFIIQNLHGTQIKLVLLRFLVKSNTEKNQIRLENDVHLFRTECLKHAKISATDSL